MEIYFNVDSGYEVRFTHDDRYGDRWRITRPIHSHDSQAMDIDIVRGPLDNPHVPVGRRRERERVRNRIDVERQVLVESGIQQDRRRIRKKALKDLYRVQRIYFGSKYPEIEETVCTRPGAFFEVNGAAKSGHHRRRRFQTVIAGEQQDHNRNNGEFFHLLRQSSDRPSENQRDACKVSRGL